MAPKKSNAKRGKSAPKRSSKPSAPRDGQNLIISSYFEVINQQGAVGADTQMSYSIRCDPRDCKLQLSSSAGATLGAEGITVAKADGTTLIAGANNFADLPFLRFAQFAPLYNQYKINKISCDVTVDRGAGLENKLMFATDKADATPAGNVGVLVGSAHKEMTMTESRRTGKYGWKPSDSQDKEYRNMKQELSDNDAHFIKVYQDIDSNANGKCTHKVLVTISATLKDSAGTAVALN